MFRKLLPAAILSLLLVAAPARGELRFEFSGTTDPELLHAAHAAAADWSGYFTNPVTVRLSLALTSTFPVNTYATAAPTFTYREYSDLRPYLPTLPEAIGYTVPRGVTVGSLVAIPTATARALGMAPDTGAVDGVITLNQNLNWDDDDTNGIGVASLSRTSVLRHEIGHALGYLSVVDVVDSWDRRTPLTVFPTLMDLSRFAAGSVPRTEGEYQTFRRMLDTEPAAASSGTGNAYTLSSGIRTGNGFSASHREFGADSIMAPTFAYERVRVVTPDAVDVLSWQGWTVKGTESGEPPALALALVTAAGCLVCRRRS